ncbi:sterol desaturase family protein, partial [Alteromonas australica]
ITMAHYFSHKYKVLWRLHAVHHSVERMYGFNGLLKHPLHQAIELSAGTLPLLLIGMPLEIGALLGFSATIQLLLQHSNVDMRLGPLKYVWAVAPGHRHHHVKDGTRGDVNFGLFTHLWDHLLGTFVTNSNERPSPRDGELGIGSQPNYPQNYISQLFQPFK